MNQGSESQLKPPADIHPKALVLIYFYISYFLQYSKQNEIPCTTKTLVEHFPRLIVEAYGLLTTIVLEKYHVNTYREIGSVLNFFVGKRIFSYSSEDRQSDFEIKSCLRIDVRREEEKYGEYLETKLSELYANSCNTDTKV